MELSLIDLHSDTAAELFRKKKSLYQNDLHVSIENASVYRRYAEVFAVYTSARLSDEDGYLKFFEIADYFQNELRTNADRIGFATSSEALSALWQSGKSAAFLAVEDARLLANDPKRIHTLFDRGVRFLTLTWKDETCIVGSWNTESGLTEFGKQTVRDCFSLGIVPDVSHASAKTIDDTLLLAHEAGRAIIATHSNSRTVYDHGRNLYDRHFKEIKNLGGIVGINLYKDHLTDPSGPPATAETIFEHIDHFMELGGENTVCFGCDFDGAELPDEIRNVSDVTSVAEVLLRHHYPESLVRKIFWENASAFFKRVFPTP
ncbi:MAG: membrane dipeptidase, partial [Clostridia bacterium]|nr:membrane dipeptidase [Clostridia bacterium]